MNKQNHEISTTETINSLYTKNCTNDNECIGLTINCQSNEDCQILCHGNNACENTKIHCPLNGYCNIECSGDKSCQDSIINSTQSIGDFSLLCKANAGANDQCNNITVLGSQLYNQTDYKFDIECMDTRSCTESDISCPKYGGCDILCNDRASCRESIINGPINNDLNISCNGVNSCVSSIFDAPQSSKLSVTGCEQDGSCLDLVIYCPPMTIKTNQNSTKNCIIEGMNIL